MAKGEGVNHGEKKRVGRGLFFLRSSCLNICSKKIVEKKRLKIQAQEDVIYSRGGPLAVFVNKALLEHSHAHLFTYCLWLLSC